MVAISMWRQGLMANILAGDFGYGVHWCNTHPALGKHVVRGWARHSCTSMCTDSSRCHHCVHENAHCTRALGVVAVYTVGSRDLAHTRTELSSIRHCKNNACTPHGYCMTYKLLFFGEFKTLPQEIVHGHQPVSEALRLDSTQHAQPHCIALPFSCSCHRTRPLHF